MTPTNGTPTTRRRAVVARFGWRPVLAAAGLLWGCVEGMGHADVLLLKNGGRVEGEWLNSDEEAAREYIVKLDNGGQIVLAKDQVARVVRTSPEQRQYRRWLEKMPQDARGNWTMAEWCGKHNLKDERLFHLEEVIRHDPNHKQARKALGYVLVDGEWTLPDEMMTARGYVLYKGRWRLPQDIALEEERSQSELAAKEWRKTIGMWRDWLGTKRHAEGEAQLLAIRDPAASSALADLLPKEPDPQVQAIYIDVLGKLRTPLAVNTLVHTAFHADRSELRELALDQLEDYGRAQAVPQFVQALRSEHNEIVRRAGAALRRLPDRSALLPLVDALTTKHRYPVDAGSPGEMTLSLGSSNSGTGGIGFGAGGSGPKYVDKWHRNREVLDALVALVGEVNYQYDKDRWRTWYYETTTPPHVDLRRGP